MRWILWINSIVFIYTHSWLHCVDYAQDKSLKVNTIDNNFCNSYPRGVSNKNNFGIDVGLDYIPSNNIACKYKYSNTITSYENGKTYRLIWPAKNHQASVCTNPFIPDNRLQLYIYPVNSLSETDPSFSTWTQQSFLYKDFKSNNGPGFQNCPDFCSNMDKAPCFGDIYINLKSNAFYKAIWVWEFNKNQFYTHCFDIRIQGNSIPPSIPTTNVPIPSKSIPSICPNKEMDKCDGINFKGVKCCMDNYVCKFIDKRISRCVPSSNALCSNKIYHQCGGKLYTGERCCPINTTCTTLNEFYFQCLPN